MTAGQPAIWLTGKTLSIAELLSSRCSTYRSAGEALSRIPARVSKSASVSFRSACLAVADLERAISTMSQPGLRGVRRMISRSKRLTLFLTTAFPTFLLTTKPQRDWGRLLGMALITTRPLCHELPLEYTRAYCSVLVRRPIPPVAPSEIALSSHHGQPLAALKASRAENLPATPGAHSF